MQFQFSEEILDDIDPEVNYYNIISENHSSSCFDSIDEFFSENPISLNDHNFISIICQNIRSIDCNLDKLLCVFDENNMPDVFILTETWYDGIFPLLYRATLVTIVYVLDDPVV